jgi:hypothetical protein
MVTFNVTMVILLMEMVALTLVKLNPSGPALVSIPSPYAQGANI